MNVDEAYYESAIPSNLFDDDIDMEENYEIPTAQTLGQQTTETQQQASHHIEVDQEAVNGNKKNLLICQKEIKEGNENGDEEKDDDDTIKALAEAVKIVQSQQQEKPGIGEDDEEQEGEMYGGKVKQAGRQQQEAERKAQRQGNTLSARLSSSPVVAPNSEQEELLLAIDQCQMDINAADSTTTQTSRELHTDKNDKSKNEEGDNEGNKFKRSISKSPSPKSYTSSNPTNCLTENLHSYPDNASLISSPCYSHFSEIDHHEPPRTTSDITTTTTSASFHVAISTTNATVIDTTLTTFSDSGSAFHPFPQNHASRSHYNSDPFAFYPSSQFRQQYEHLFQQQCIAHAITEYQQMARWDANGTVPSQYPMSPYLPPQSPPTPIGSSFSYQMQHNQWPLFQQQQQNLQFHHTQIMPQSNQNRMNPPLPHPLPTYYPRQLQPQYETSLNFATPTPTKAMTTTSNRSSSIFNPTSIPEASDTQFSSSGYFGNAQEKPVQQSYTILKRSNSPKKYLKPKYVPLKESMYVTTTASSSSLPNKSSVLTTRAGQHYRKRSNSTQTITTSTSESEIGNQIYPTITPHPPDQTSTPNAHHQFSENSTQ